MWLCSIKQTTRLFNYFLNMILTTDMICLFFSIDSIETIWVNEQHYVAFIAPCTEFISRIVTIFSRWLTKYWNIYLLHVCTGSQHQSSPCFLRKQNNFNFLRNNLKVISLSGIWCIQVGWLEISHCWVWVMCRSSGKFTSVIYTRKIRPELISYLNQWYQATQKL